tara:strand:+ start:893 stop:2281 length:1389 start_codon:yes stop_codon:yes gene_type:complete
MITNLAGEIGAGKTTFALVQWAVPYIESGRNFATDIALREDEWRARFGDEVWEKQVRILKKGDPVEKTGHELADIDNFEKLLQWKDDEGRGPLIIVDEAYSVWPAGITQVKDRKTGMIDPDCAYQKMVDSFAMIRHTASHLVVIAQIPKTIFAPLRDLAKESYFIENTDMLGAPNSFRAKIFAGPFPTLTIAGLRKVKIDECDHIGYPKPKGYDKDVQKLFLSHTKMKEGASVESPKALESKRSVKSIWRSPKIWVPLVLMVPALYFAFGEELGIRGDASEGSQEPSEAIPVADGAMIPEDPENLPSEPEFSSRDEIRDLDEYARQQDWEISRFVIEDSRYWKYDENENGDVYYDFPVTVYGPNGEIIYANGPATWIASKTGMSVEYVDECTVNFSKGGNVVHEVKRPGCEFIRLAEERARMERDSRRAEAPEKPPRLPQAEQSNENRMREAAERLTIPDVP